VLFNYFSFLPTESGGHQMQRSTQLQAEEFPLSMNAINNYATLLQMHERKQVNSKQLSSSHICHHAQVPFDAEHRE
jgi:hypothetical protein